MKKESNLALYNENYFAVMANDIIKGRQSMTLQAARLLRLMISKVVKEDKDLRTYVCKITELARFLGIPKNDMYRDVQSICDKLHKSCVYIGTGNPKRPWRQLNWISMSEYDGKGNLTIRLSEDIKPYVVGLEKYFTQYQLKNILSFSSFYALRLYELIKYKDGMQREGMDSVEFSIQELREAVDCLEKYKPFANFRIKVIDIAVKEINEKSDIEVTPQYMHEGRKITGVKFELHINKNPNNPNSPINKIIKKQENNTN